MAFKANGRRRAPVPGRSSVRISSAPLPSQYATNATGYAARLETPEVVSYSFKQTPSGELGFAFAWHLVTSPPLHLPAATINL